MYGHKNYRSSVVTFAWLLSYAFTVLAAGGKLGISQDVTGEGYFHWSSVAVYSEDTAKLFPEDKDIAAVAKAAYNELMVDLNEERDEPLADTQKPYTIAALAVGKEIYFSTTLIGPAFMYTSRIRDTVSDAVAEEVSLALKRCQVESYDGNTGHRTGAACGEPLAAQQWCATNKQIKLSDQNGRVVTWGKYGRDEPDDDVGILDPCEGGTKAWGCAAFLRKINVKGVRDTLGGRDPGDPSTDPTSTRKACFWDSGSSED